MAQNKDDIECNVWRRLYDDLEERLDKECYEVGRLRAMYNQVNAELFFYQRKYGRLDFWDWKFKILKRLKYN